MGVLFPDDGESRARETLEAYEARGGWQALRRKPAPDEIVSLVEAAGLTGRGGAGFPTAKKWRLAKEQPGPRYVVMNGGEDEPGSHKDRILMEHHPHLVLAGVLLAAHALEAGAAYLYVNHAYTKAHASMQAALDQVRSAGNLQIKIELFAAPSEYVAGEDTASLEAIEGRKALPRQKPPYPTVAGLFGKPTVVNNVETFANVPRIVLHGADWFRAIGSGNCKGTAIFCLGDEVERPGAYELPFGTPLSALVARGGGLKGGRKIKAILPGGPSSAYLKADELDVPLDYQSLKDAGSALGCGVVHLVAEGECLVEEVQRIADFFARECCGQCPPCRMETGMLKAILDKVQKGEGNADQLAQLDKLVAFARGKGLCGFIHMPGPPLLSAVKHFPQDFIAHLETKRCPAATAKNRDSASL
jgi:NADH-quinone oxidoreductase subunit F